MSSSSSSSSCHQDIDAVVSLLVEKLSQLLSAAKGVIGHASNVGDFLDVASEGVDSIVDTLEELEGLVGDTIDEEEEDTKSDEDLLHPVRNKSGSNDHSPAVNQNLGNTSSKKSTTTLVDTSASTSKTSVNSHKPPVRSTDATKSIGFQGMLSSFFGDMQSFNNPVTGSKAVKPSATPTQESAPANG